MHGRPHGSDCHCIPEKVKYAWVKASLALYISLLHLVSMADGANFVTSSVAYLDALAKSLIFSKEIIFSSQEHIKWLAWIQRSTQVYTEIFYQSCVRVQWDLESTCLKLNTAAMFSWASLIPKLGNSISAAICTTNLSSWNGMIFFLFLCGMCNSKSFAM